MNNKKRKLQRLGEKGKGNYIEWLREQERKYKQEKLDKEESDIDHRLRNLENSLLKEKKIGKDEDSTHSFGGDFTRSFGEDFTQD